MPMFDFRCTACGHTFEALVRGATNPACPHCGSSALDKLLAAAPAAGNSQAVIASARQAAARAGHFSNYSAAERRRLLG